MIENEKEVYVKMKSIKEIIKRMNELFISIIMRIT
jgi:hypothetical protein